jgi:hypothetical protein
MRMIVLAFTLVLATVAGMGGVAVAQTPAADPAVAPAAPAAEPVAAPAPPPTPPAVPKLTVEQILAQLRDDPALSDELARQLKARWALELNEETRKRHDDDSRQIALNKRHVVLAYGALWLLAVVFLVLQWRRQQGLEAQIAQLHKELEAATREGAR